MTPTLQNKIEEALNRFDEKFDGLWLDGMFDYENETPYGEKETIEKIKSFLEQELSSIATLAQEDALESVESGVRCIETVDGSLTDCFKTLVLYIINKHKGE